MGPGWAPLQWEVLWWRVLVLGGRDGLPNRNPRRSLTCPRRRWVVLLFVFRGYLGLISVNVTVATTACATAPCASANVCSRA